MSKKKYIIISFAIIILAVFFVSGQILKSKDAPKFDGPTYQVKRGPLVISFAESGTIKARDQVIIKNEVEGRTSIISLIPEGTRVKKGDLLVELDASSLQDQKIDQEIKVQNAEASYISAKENLAVVENQTKSDTDRAELTFEFAKQDLGKYVKGEYPYELDKAEAEITLAEEELTQASETLKWSQRLYEEKYIAQTELQGHEISQKKKNLDVTLAKKRRDLLTEYTKGRKLAQLQSDVSQAEMALERTRRKAGADIIQSQAGLKAKEAEYQRQKDKLKKIEDQIAKTRIYAPADGLVIYATSARTGGFRGSSDTPLEEGRDLREREEIIYLPTGQSSKAEITIHESNLEKTRTGQQAVVTVDALPGKVFYGTVERIAPLPDARSMWMNPDLKVYNSEIHIDGSDDVLRTGMSCQAEIIVQRYQDVIYVPLQAVTRIGREPTVYVKKKNSFEPRTVKIGLDNNKMIHILEGLQEGEVVLLNPPLKSAAADSHNYDNMPEQFSQQNADEIKVPEEISERLKNAETEKPAEQTAQPTTDESMDKRGQRERFENLDPEKREIMRRQFREISPQEREKMRQRYGRAMPQNDANQAPKQEKQ